MKGISSKIWIIVFALISVEQTIKIVINSYYLDMDIPVLPSVIHFKPMFNRDYSWFNSMLQLGVGKGLHIAIVLILIALIFKFFAYLNFRRLNDNVIDSIFTFVISGAVCSLIDKVFWNGSLDYIALKGFFTFDLKDLYVDTSIGLLIFCMIKGNKAIRLILEDKTVMKGFTRTILHRDKPAKETGNDSVNETGNDSVNETGDDSVNKTGDDSVNESGDDSGKISGRP